VFRLWCQRAEKHEDVALLGEFHDRRLVLNSEALLDILRSSSTRVVQDRALWRNSLNLCNHRRRNRAESNDAHGGCIKVRSLCIPRQIPSRRREGNTHLIHGVTKSQDGKRDTIVSDVLGDRVDAISSHFDATCLGSLHVHVVGT